MPYRVALLDEQSSQEKSDEAGSSQYQNVLDLVFGSNNNQASTCLALRPHFPHNSHSAHLHPHRKPSFVCSSSSTKNTKSKLACFRICGWCPNLTICPAVNYKLNSKELVHRAQLFPYPSVKFQRVDPPSTTFSIPIC